MSENLNPEERKKIYEEEKAKLKSNHQSSIFPLLVADIVLLFFLLSLIKLSRKKIHPKIDDLRKAYPGL